MKKLLLFFLFVFSSISVMYAWTPEFGWNHATTASLGYWKIHSPYYPISPSGNKMETSLLGVDAHLGGAYLGFGFSSETCLFRLGPSWRLFWDINEVKLSFTPYALVSWSNMIGHETEDPKTVYGGGLKVTFAYKKFEIGISGSNRDFGIGIGVNFVDF